MTSTYHEVNFDGLIGPTHNYSGLSPDNIACQTHKGSTSHPKAAALQGLEKMKFLKNLGLHQAILPPHPRPNLDFLENVGFHNPQDTLSKIHKFKPHLLSAAYSASAMWTANAATISPSCDTADKKLHLTPANLISELHRSLEPSYTYRTLKAIFHNSEKFTVHDPLFPAKPLADEGAANHTRLRGTHIFTYSPIGRQSLQASQAIARLHQLDPNNCIFLKQHPDAIRHGVFHNDVIAVGNDDTYFFHELAYADSNFKEKLSGFNLIEVPEKEIPLKTAVDTYLFNSQLLSLPGGETALVAPTECEENPTTKAYLDNFPHKVHYINVRESMKNGGGPACLRLRVLMSEDEIAALPQSIFLNDNNYKEIKNLINSHYRDELHPEALADPKLIHESSTIIEKLNAILGINP